MKPSILRSVVFPLPEGPQIETNSPRSIVIETFRSAGTVTFPSV